MKKVFKQSIAVFIVLIFSLQGLGLPLAYGQQAAVAPLLVQLSPAFNPAVLRGLRVDRENPFHFDFILDNGQSNFKGEELKKEGTKLIKYFLASLTLPEDDLWVNLSPFEKDRIIPNEFGTTEMGRQLLTQDYLLKKLSASLTNPETELGQKFWEKINKQTAFDVPRSTFNRIWIMPEKAVVYQDQGTAFVGETHLKVLLEEDYVAMSNQRDMAESRASARDLAQEKTLDARRLPLEKNTATSVSTQIFREQVLPIIEKEVNEGKNFASLRQIYHSLILASWYKRTLKESILSRVYVDQKKMAGMESNDQDAKEKIYNQYLETFKKGVYNLIREDLDETTGEMIPRKYFSGGVGMTTVNLNNAIDLEPLSAGSSIKTGALTIFETQMNGAAEQKPDTAGSTAIIQSLNRMDAKELKDILREGYIQNRIHSVSQFSAWKDLVTDQKKMLVAGVFVLRKINGQWSFLLGQRKDGATDKQGFYSGPIGKVDQPSEQQYENIDQQQKLKEQGVLREEDLNDSRESIPAAAVRELFQETGIQMTIGDIHGRIDDFRGNHDGILVNFMVAVDTSADPLVKETAELGNFQWVPLETILKYSDAEVGAQVEKYLQQKQPGAPLMHGLKSAGMRNLRKIFIEALGLPGKPPSFASTGVVNFDFNTYYSDKSMPIDVNKVTASSASFGSEIDSRVMEEFIEQMPKLNKEELAKLNMAIRLSLGFVSGEKAQGKISEIIGREGGPSLIRVRKITKDDVPKAVEFFKQQKVMDVMAPEGFRAATLKYRQEGFPNQYVIFINEEHFSNPTHFVSTIYHELIGHILSDELSEEPKSHEEAETRAYSLNLEFLKDMRRNIDQIREVVSKTNVRFGPAVGEAAVIAARQFVLDALNLEEIAIQERLVEGMLRWYLARQQAKPINPPGKPPSSASSGVDSIENFEFDSQPLIYSTDSAKPEDFDNITIASSQVQKPLDPKVIQDIFRKLQTLNREEAENANRMTEFVMNFPGEPFKSKIIALVTGPNTLIGRVNFLKVPKAEQAPLFAMLKNQGMVDDIAPDFRAMTARQTRPDGKVYYYVLINEQEFLDPAALFMLIVHEVLGHIISDEIFKPKPTHEESEVRAYKTEISILGFIRDNLAQVKAMVQGQSHPTGKDFLLRALSNPQAITAEIAVAVSNLAQYTQLVQRNKGSAGSTVFDHSGPVASVPDQSASSGMETVSSSMVTNIKFDFNQDQELESPERRAFLGVLAAGLATAFVPWVSYSAEMPTLDRITGKKSEAVLLQELGGKVRPLSDIKRPLSDPKKETDRVSEIDKVNVLINIIARGIPPQYKSRLQTLFFGSPGKQPLLRIFAVSENNRPRVREIVAELSGEKDPLAIDFRAGVFKENFSGGTKYSLIIDEAEFKNATGLIKILAHELIGHILMDEVQGVLPTVTEAEIRAYTTEIDFMTALKSNIDVLKRMLSRDVKNAGMDTAQFAIDGLNLEDIQKEINSANKKRDAYKALQSKLPKRSEQNSNSAAGSPAFKAQSDKLGGIDLREKGLNLDLRGQSGVFTLPIDPAQIDNIRIDGLIPIILNITPIPSLPAFLSQIKSQEQPKLSLSSF